MSSARRQVLIEATIAEVTLSQNYQQGIDWQRLRADGTGFALTQAAPGVVTSSAGNSATATVAGGPQLSAITQTPSGSLTSAATNSLFVLGYRNAPSAAISFAAAVKLLESFGNVKVLSSPKLSVLNNQTALLNVGNQVVYFKVNASSTTANGINTTTVDTTPQTASVGLLMSVTPQISEDGTVLLNVRPSITRITGYKLDPNPAIPAGLSNQVPEIQRREMESVLRIGNGDIAMLGGLMQDGIDYKDDGVPGLSRVPLLGNLFSYKNETNTKTELVIFLRPTIVKDASIDGDYRAYRDSLPGRDYLRPTWKPKPLPEDSGS
jgi:general secretion pathway protein D